MSEDIHIGQITELRQFGRQLNQASGALSNLFNQLGSQMSRVCGTWKDTQAQRFMEDVNQSRRQVDRMAQTMMEFSRYIEEYCKRADAVMNMRR